MRNKHDARRDREFPPRWTIAVGVIFVIGCLLWTIWSLNSKQQEADDANTNAKALAEQVTQACANGEVKVNGRNICTKAKQVKEDVKPSQPGPAGPPGPKGVPGQDSTIPGPVGKTGGKGEDSNIPGPAGQPGKSGNEGEHGAPGKDSTVPGPAGQAGAPGKDSSIPGPAGAPGSKGEKGEKGDSGPPGSKGDKGEKGDTGNPGSSGRGIKDVTCTSDGDWLFEFTDGTTVTVTGPCRAQQAEPPSTTAP